VSHPTNLQFLSQVPKLSLSLNFQGDLQIIEDTVSEKKAQGPTGCPNVRWVFFFFKAGELEGKEEHSPVHRQSI
jgi:hypothetical protein